MTAPEIINEKIKLFLDILDNDIFYLELSIGRLEQLASYVADRNHKALEDLLRRVSIDRKKHLADEAERQTLRKEIAAVLGESITKVNLGFLIDYAADDNKAKLQAKKKQLENLTSQLARQIRSVSIFLTQCIRINSSILRNLMALDKGASSAYTQKGSSVPVSRSVFMNYRM